MQSIAEKVVENLLNKGLVDKEEGESLMQDLLLDHRPVGDRRKMGRASFQVITNVK
jgi:polyhydroxyalkanoate synthesis regulator phasin